MAAAVTLPEVASACRAPLSRLEGLVVRYKVAPAFRVGPVRYYGPDQVKKIRTLVNRPVTSAGA